MGTTILPRPRPYKNLIVWWSHTRVSLEPWERIPSSFSLVWALVGDWSSSHALAGYLLATRPRQWWRLSALRYEVLEIATTGGLNTSRKWGMILDEFGIQGIQRIPDISFSFNDQFRFGIINPDKWCGPWIRSLRISFFFLKMVNDREKVSFLANVWTSLVPIGQRWYLQLHSFLCS